MGYGQILDLVSAGYYWAASRWTCGWNVHIFGPNPLRNVLDTWRGTPAQHDDRSLVEHVPGSWGKFQIILGRRCILLLLLLCREFLHSVSILFLFLLLVVVLYLYLLLLLLLCCSLLCCSVPLFLCSSASVLVCCFVALLLLLCCSAALLLCCSAALLLAALLLCCSVARCSDALLLCCSLFCFSAALLFYYSAALLICCSAALLLCWLCCSAAVADFCSFAIVAYTVLFLQDNANLEWTYKKTITIQTYCDYHPIPVPLNLISIPAMAFYSTLKEFSPREEDKVFSKPFIWNLFMEIP